MIFVAFAMCMAGAIEISRELAVKSECEAFGRVWTKAILSEYDLPLLEDYDIMAYFGNDYDVTDKLENYLEYSTADRLNIDIGGANADLTGYELGDPDNFSNAVKKSLAGSVAREMLLGTGRQKRSTILGTDDIGSDDEGSLEGGGSGRVIRNSVVLDTLPSGGIGNTPSLDSLIERAKSLGSADGLTNALGNAGSEVIFIEKHFDNAVTYASDKDSFFRNEWEYVIKGNADDDENLKSVKRTLFLMRNALNLLSLYQDPAKVQMIESVAGMITPGPLMLVTQLILAEAWAALETEADMKDLLDNKRVPVLKTAEQWQTGLGAVLDSEEISEKLDEESKELLNENRGEIESVIETASTIADYKDGLCYDDYLMIMILSMNERVRLLRIMDIVQINMKYRYYRDFNMMEYYVGTRFSIDANGRSYEFEDEYN